MSDRQKQVIGEMQANYREGGSMSESEFEQIMRERGEVVTKEAKIELPKTKEEFDAYENKINNSDDIYKIAARIKNLARGSRRNLTPHGEMLCNSFVHVLKSFYEFAETLPDPYREKLHRLTRAKEGVPGDIIAASMVNVQNPEEEENV